MSVVDWVCPLCSSPGFNGNTFGDVLETSLEVAERICRLISKEHVNQLDPSGYSILHYLSKKSRNRMQVKKIDKMITYLFENQGADPNIATNPNRDTPLHLAAAESHTSRSIQILLDYNADPNRENNYRETPLHIAAKRGKKSLIRLLIERGASLHKRDYQGRIPKEVAEEAEHNQTIQNLLDPTITEKRSSNLMSLFPHHEDHHYGRDILKQLQFYAEQNEYERFAEILNSEDINLSKLVNLQDEDGKTLLMVTCYQDKYQLVKLFLEQGAIRTINVQDQNGWTALHFACYSCTNPRIIELILALREVDVNIPTKEDSVPLHYLAKNNKLPIESKLRIIGMFKAKNANFNVQNFLGETPLHSACYANSVATVKSLIENGADVNIQTFAKRETPLHWAARLGFYDIAKTFLDNGAEKGIRGSNGTALDIASAGKSRKPEMIQLLGGNATDKAQMFWNQMAKQGRTGKFIPKVEQEQEKDVSEAKYSWIVDRKEITISKSLGRGSFSEVYQASFRNQTVAVKILNRKPLESAAKMDEFEILRSMRSPFIVYFYGLILEPQLCLVMQYCAKGSMSHVLSQKDYQLQWPTLFKWCQQFVQGVRDLHSWKPSIIHRDLKTQNLLIDANDNCVVSDFGVSRFVIDEKETTLSKLRGTYAYSAPEMYYNQKATTHSDVYSIGMIFWEITNKKLSGYQIPYSEFEDIHHDFQIIVQVASLSRRPTMPKGLNPQFANLIRSCWSQNIIHRPTTQQILEELAGMEESYKTNPNHWEGLAHVTR